MSTSKIAVVVGCLALACKREQAPAPPAAHSAAPIHPMAAAPIASVSASVSTPAPAAPSAASHMLTLPSGNVNGLGKPNVWAHVPAAYRESKPLRVAFIFHGFSNCLESFVADVGVPCRPTDPPRTAYDLAAQIERSGTSAIVIVPQLAYDEKNGAPGVIDNGPALEKLTRETLDALEIKRPVEQVTMIALSGGYQALYSTLTAFGDNVRSVFLLDAYYAEAGALDLWFNKSLPDFAAHTRKLGVIYSALDTTRVPSQGFAMRAATLFKDTVHKSEPHDITVDELAAPVSFLFAKAEHDDIPRTDLAKVLAAAGG